MNHGKSDIQVAAEKLGAAIIMGSFIFGFFIYFASKNLKFDYNGSNKTTISVSASAGKK